jgi:hypothetical protein
MIVLVYDNREKIIEPFSSMGPCRYEPFTILFIKLEFSKIKNKL